LDPLANEALLQQIVDELARFEFKLRGQRRVVFHSGKPNRA